MVPGESIQMPGVDVSSPWVLRLIMNESKMINKQIDIEFVDRKLNDSFSDMLQTMHSDANDEH